MLKRKSSQKGIVLLIVLATILIIVILSGIVLNTTVSQSRLTQHQVSRIQAYYAGKGMMNFVLEKMRTDSNWAPDASAPKYACYRGCIDAAVTPTSGLDIPLDDKITYKVQVTIYPVTSNGKIDIKTAYPSA